MHLKRSIVLFVSVACLAGCVTASQAEEKPEISSLEFSFKPIETLKRAHGVIRRDPSDVIKVDDTYYVYYTKVVKKELPKIKCNLGGSGYPGVLYYATSKDTYEWTERGEILGLGKKGTWDSFGIFTPAILKHDGKFWLYYTGVQPTPGREDGVFENNGHNDYTAIGVVVSDSPAGPFKRLTDQPVLKINEEREFFDSYRVDDACMVMRDGKVWMYYKGRSLAKGKSGPRNTKMGVAVADKPEGPYIKMNDGKNIQDSGHEVQIFKYGKAGVMSIVSSAGPNRNTLQYAKDGLNLEVLLRDLKKMPHAQGLYRPELTDHDAGEGLPEWGISMVYGTPYLIRYECKWNAEKSVEAKK